MQVLIEAWKFDGRKRKRSAFGLCQLGITRLKDRFANYQTVAQTLADLQRRGLQKIGFVNNDFN